MDDKKETKELVKVVWPTGPVTTGYKVKSCHHTGETPILIGGIEIRLGGSPAITQTAIKASNLLISLNGQLPYMAFGQIIQFQYATLADRGGVPSNWAEFVESTANNMRNGYKLLFWCHGSHGRTGCLGASLIAFMEPEVLDPIEEIRKRHCSHAVESLEQATAIFSLKGLELPEKYAEEFKKPVYNTSSYSYGPEPLANGKDKDGKYYHHLLCKCVKCSYPTMKFAMAQDIPCECKGLSCLWDGKARPAVGPFAHCAKCACGLCMHSRYHLVTYCQCPDALCKNKAGGEVDQREKALPSQTSQAKVINIESADHEWYCICKSCITAECSLYPCRGGNNCNCYSCVVADRKWELSLVTSLNNAHGRTNHPDKCACMQCIQDLEDLENQALAAAEEDEEDDTYRYCMELADNGSECLGDTSLPCKHMIAEDEAMELAAAQLNFGEEVHGIDCQCQNCWALETAYIS